MNKIKVDHTYTCNNGSSVHIIAELQNPVLKNLPFVGIFTTEAGETFTGYLTPEGYFADKHHSHSVKWGPTIRQTFRRVYTDGLIGNSAPSIDALPVTTDHGGIHGILVFTYHDDVLHNTGFARAQ